MTNADEMARARNRELHERLFKGGQVWLANEDGKERRIVYSFTDRKGQPRVVAEDNTGCLFTTIEAFFDSHAPPPADYGLDNLGWWAVVFRDRDDPTGLETRIGFKRWATESEAWESTTLSSPDTVDGVIWVEARAASFVSRSAVPAGS